jgi:hypothetical protein
MTDSQGTPLPDRWPPYCPEQAKCFVSPGLCALKGHCTIDFVSVLRKLHKARRYGSAKQFTLAAGFGDVAMQRYRASYEWRVLPPVSIAPTAPRASLNLGLVALIDDIPKTNVSKCSERVAEP